MKIQLIGASGSGKSTLAAKLARELKLPLLSGDRYLWADDTFTRNHPVEERRKMLLEDMKHTSFIFDGAVDSWCDDIGIDPDLLIFLRMDDQKRLKRLYDREYERFGSRILEGGDLYENSQEFLAWAASYETDTAVKGNCLGVHLRLVREAKCRTVTIDAALPEDEVLMAALEHISAL